MNNNPIYIILHLHKCGGVSMSKHLIKHLKKGEYRGFYKSTNRYLENRVTIKAYLSSLSPAAADQIRVLYGHGVYYGIHKLFRRPCRYVVFLRNPHTRTISNYAYFVQKTLSGSHIGRKSVVNPQGHLYDFDQWLRSRTTMHDYMVRWLYAKLFYRNIPGTITRTHLKKVQTALKQFYLVGILENPIDRWFLYANIGIPIRATRENVTKKEYYPQHVRTAYTSRYLTKDTELYKYFQKHPIPKKSPMTWLSLYVRYVKERWTHP